MRCIPIAALEREKQKGGNDGDGCTGKKQNKHSENLRKAPQPIESHEYTARQNWPLLYQGAGSTTANVVAFIGPESQSQIGFRSVEQEQQWSLQNPANGPKKRPNC